MHIAAKFGSIDCMAVLLEYSICDADKLNSEGKKVAEVLCSRQGDEMTKQQMEILLQNRYYVNLFKQINLSGIMEELLQVEVSFGKLLAFEKQTLIENKKLERKIWAIAGPMNLMNANELKRKFRSPLNRSMNEIQVNLTDHANAGYIRIARTFCRMNSFQWKEFWPFLNLLIDLASDEGLQKLENHLKSKLFVSSNFTFHSSSIEFFLC